MVGLSRLSMLPSRKIEPGTEALAKDAMFRALDGVTAYAFEQAVTNILQGGLSHTFFPTPVELRLLCDRAQRPHENMARRIRATEQQLAERAEDDRLKARVTPQAKARCKAIYERYCAGFEKETVAHESKLDPDLVALVPDAPQTFRKVA